jgi:hypothetical protein
MLDLHGIFADDKVAEILNAGHRGLGFALQCALSPADQSLIGLEFDENVGSIGIGR